MKCTNHHKMQWTLPPLLKAVRFTLIAERFYIAQYAQYHKQIQSFPWNIFIHIFSGGGGGGCRGGGGGEGGGGGGGGCHPNPQCKKNGDGKLKTDFTTFVRGSQLIHFLHLKITSRITGEQGYKFLTSLNNFERFYLGLS